MPSPDRAPPPLLSEPRIAAGPVALRALERGDAQGPPVLYLHGWLDHAHGFDWLIDALPPGWRHVALDFRGHGRSGHHPEGGAYPFPVLLADIDFTLTQLGMAPAHLVAHSMGGAAAALYAAIRPQAVRSLTLIDNLGVSGGPPEALLQRLDLSVSDAHKPLRTKTYPSLAEAVARVRENNPGFSAAIAEHLTRFGTEPTAGGVRFTFDPAHRRSSGFGMDDAQLLASLRAIRCPTQLIRGSRGHALEPERLEARLAALGHPPVHTVEGGHHVHLDSPAEVAVLVERFIEAQRTATPR